jgi:osmoprotectant transport system permease protein
MIAQAAQYALSHRAELFDALGRHLELVGVALAIGIVVCVPLGILTARSRWASLIVTNSFNALRVIPSLAILFLALPYFGLTFTSSAIALTLLALPPILINTDAAFRSIDPAVREVAYGLGMTPRQVLRWVEFPLALPVIIAGIRTSAVEVIASATLAAFIGAGGLGLYIVRGFAMYDISILLVGAIPVALLALIAESLMNLLQRAVQPPLN